MTDPVPHGAPSRAAPIAVAVVAGLLVVVAAIVLPMVLKSDDDGDGAGTARREHRWTPATSTWSRSTTCRRGST